MVKTSSRAFLSIVVVLLCLASMVTATMGAPSDTRRQVSSNKKNREWLAVLGRVSRSATSFMEGFFEPFQKSKQAGDTVDTTQQQQQGKKSIPGSRGSFAGGKDAHAAMYASTFNNQFVDNDNSDEGPSSITFTDLAGRESSYHRDGFFESLSTLQERFGDAVLDSGRAIRAIQTGQGDMAQAATYMTPPTGKRRKDSKNKKVHNNEDEESMRNRDLHSLHDEHLRHRHLYKKGDHMPLEVAAKFVEHLDGFIHDPNYPLRRKLNKQQELAASGAVSRDEQLRHNLRTGRLEAEKRKKEDAIHDDDDEVTSFKKAKLQDEAGSNMEQMSPGRQQHHRRSFSAQAATQTRTNADGSPYVPTFCKRGAIAVPYTNTSTFMCNVSQTADGNLTEVIMDEYITFNQSFREQQCETESTQKLCVCPRHTALYESVYGDLDCFTRPSYCSHSIVTPARDCPTRGIMDNEIEPVCFRTTRNAKLEVDLNVTCDWSVIPDAVYRSWGVTPVDPPSNNQTFIIVSYSPTLKNIKQNNDTMPNGTLWIGTHDVLIREAFVWWDSNPEKDVYLAEDMFLVSSGNAFFQIYNFKNPRNTSGFFDIQFNNKASFTNGTLTGQVFFKHTFDLSQLGDDFLSGNRMYMEAGVIFRGGATGADRMHIDFTDVSRPKDRPMTAGLSGGAVAAIVIVCLLVAVVLVISAFVGYKRYQKNQATEEEKDLD